MKKFLILFTFLLGNIFTSQATHVMGGEITWVCLPNGQFQFFMKIYRDCNGVPFGSQQTDLSDLEIHNYPTVGSPILQMPKFLVSQTDISPQCNVTGPAITCADPGGMSGAVEEFVFRTDPVTLTGTPPPQGWIISYDGCCRNAATTNINNAGNEGFVLRAKMFAYNGRNTNPCYDSSPAFAEKPTLVTCAGRAFSYNHNAFDNELDSLSYSWAPALDDFSLPWNEGVQPPLLNYASDYSANSPLPGTTHNPSNIPAQLNPATGEISFTSFTAGNFTTIVKVEAWKCGTKVAEIYRETQITILASCWVNSAPVISTPGGIFNGYSATVNAGDLVTFDLSGVDPGFLPNGDPQSVSVSATGSQFGTGFTNAFNGCLNPPCATLSPPPPASGTNGSTTTFSWQTDCNHISFHDECATASNTYTFVFRFSDDFCPVPAVNSVTVSITVLSDSLVASPELRCASVLSNGDVELTWSVPANAGNTFDSYHLYHSGSVNGPFTLLDSLFNINTTSYTHFGANANNASQYYYISTRSGCNGGVYNSSPDTVATIFPVINNPGNGVADLSWNALATPLPSSTLNGYYRIYRMLPGENWVLIDSTQSLSYHDTISICNDSIYYRVEIEDNSGCISVSAITGDIILSDNVVADFTSLFITSFSYGFSNNSDNALYYYWDFGDGASSTFENTTHNFSDTGSYIITLTAWNACDTDTFIMPLAVTGINDLEPGNSFSIFPNPASTVITVTLSVVEGQSSGIKPQTLKIVNTIGQVVFTSTFDIQHSTFDISFLPTGLYHLLLEDEQGIIHAKKFVVSR